MKKLIALVLSIAILEAAYRADATQITIKNSTGNGRVSVYTNADNEFGGCSALSAGIATGFMSFGITTIAAGAKEAPAENDRWNEVKFFKDKALFKDITLCTWGPLVVSPTDPAYCFKGDKNDFYSQIVVPTGQIWNNELAQVSAAGGRPIVSMSR